MSLDIHHMAQQVEQHRRDRQVVREHESLPRTGRHPLIIRFGVTVSRLGHRLQGFPEAPDGRPVPNPGPAIG